MTSTSNVASDDYYRVLGVPRDADARGEAGHASACAAGAGVARCAATLQMSRYCVMMRFRWHRRAVYLPTTVASRRAPSGRARTRERADAVVAVREFDERLARVPHKLPEIIRTVTLREQRVDRR